MDRRDPRQQQIIGVERGGNSRKPAQERPCVDVRPVGAAEQSLDVARIAYDRRAAR
jgi:hypothetical protein